MDPAQLHKEAFVFDLHSHALLNMTYLGRDISRRGKSPWVWNPLRNMIDLPKLAEGQVDGLVWTVYVPWNPLIPRDRAVLHCMAVFDAFIARHPDRVAHVRTASEARSAASAGRLACFLGVEGGHSLGGKLANVGEFARRGAVYLTIAHFFPNGVASSADFGRVFQDKGLTPFGREVVRECQRHRVLVDLAHCSERSFREAMDLTEGPVLFSHTGARALQPIERNISDEQARSIARRGGVIGVIFFSAYHRRGILGRLEDLLDNLCHLVRIAGADHVCIGSDMDGWIWAPLDLPDVSHLPRLTEGLVRRGFSDAEIQGILGGNFLQALTLVRP